MLPSPRTQPARAVRGEALPTALPANGIATKQDDGSGSGSATSRTKRCVRASQQRGISVVFVVECHSSGSSQKPPQGFCDLQGNAWIKRRKRCTLTYRSLDVRSCFQCDPLQTSYLLLRQFKFMLILISALARQNLALRNVR